MDRTQASVLLLCSITPRPEEDAGQNVDGYYTATIFAVSASRVEEQFLKAKALIGRTSFAQCETSHPFKSITLIDTATKKDTILLTPSQLVLPRTKESL